MTGGRPQVAPTKNGVSMLFVGGDARFSSLTLDVPMIRITVIHK